MSKINKELSIADRQALGARCTKEHIINAFGNCCTVCGYNKSPAVLAFHHINPGEKETSFASKLMTKKIWPRLVKELRKCILVCHNCHAEIHQGITKVPRNAIQFDELYSLYWVEDKHSDKCVCGNKKEIWKQTCSEKCTRVIRGIKISHSKTNLKWKDIDLINELKTQTISELSRSLGCGWDTVKRNYDKQKEVCNVNEVRHI